MNHLPRILHLISRLDGYGGARLLRELTSRHAAAGRFAEIVALQASAAVVKELTCAGASVRVLDCRWPIEPIALARLVRWRRRSRVDVVHAWDSSALVYAALGSRRTPMVAAWEAAEDQRSWVSSFTAIDVSSLPVGVAPPGPRRLDRSAALAALDLPSDACIIAVAGLLTRDRNLDDSIWNFELVRVLHPRAHLVVFGDGPDRARLERYAELVSEPGCVRFAGFRSDFRVLLPHANVYWQNDATHPTPHALLEAMAACVPTVATDMAGRRELIVTGVTGFLTPAKNRAEAARATDHLLRDPTMAKRIGAAAAELVVRRHPLERSLAACERVYRPFAPGH